MADMTNSEIELAWAAGVISTAGTIHTPTANQKQVVQLVMSSRRHPEMVRKLAEIAGSNTTNVGQDVKMSLTGDKLHAFMKLIWDKGLTKARQKEYIFARKKAYGEVQKLRDDSSRAKK